MPTRTGGARDASRWSRRAADAFEAARRLADGVDACAGGTVLRAGPVPMALHDAVWMPAPSRVGELGASADALAAPGDPAEPALRDAGHRPALGVRANDPFAAGELRVAPAGGDGRVGWHGARDVATVLAGEHDAPELLAPLATSLASIASADDALRLHLSGAPGAGRAALVSVDTGEAIVALLAGGPAEPLVARVLAEGRALGMRTGWTRLTAPDDARAALLRWEADAFLRAAT